MDSIRFDRLARSLSLGSRRAGLRLAAGGLAVLLGPFARDASAGKKQCKKKRRGPCAGKNWCVDRSHTCGPVGSFGKCVVGAFGSNICGEILFQAASCTECDPANCTNCRCVLAAGGGDRCNNGVNGQDFICVRPV